MTQKYRLNSLGWYNFERLVQSLLKASIGAGVTSFGGSKDKGRDATFRGAANYPNDKTQWSGYWVFQVKFIDYEEKPSIDAQSRLRSQLCSEMKKIIKKKRKRPDNYILITNISVSADNRDKLNDVALDCGFIENYATIDGEEICQLLDNNPEIRRTYPQLLGLADLKTIINSDIYTRSLLFFNEWSSRMAKFVHTDAYFEAINKLNKHNFIVIDGPPEVGKSMIAAASAFIYSADGFSVYNIRNPDDLLKIFSVEEKQIFIADDAVGSISFDPGLADTWSRDFSKIYLALDKNHKLVWTARSYILEEAIHESRLGENIKDFPGIHEILIEVSNFTIMQKAEILYNHAKLGNLSPSGKKQIQENAERIVHHANITPEKIRQLINDFLSSFSESDNNGRLLNWHEIDSFLNNPSIHWIKAYTKLHPSEKILLSAMLDFDRFPSYDEVKTSYEQRRANLEDTPLAFETCLNRLNHSFLKTETQPYSGKIIDFQHPVIRDLIISNLQNDDQALLKHIELASPNAIAEIIRGFCDEIVENENVKHLIVIKKEDHFVKLLHRIENLSQLTIPSWDWSELLSSLETIVPDHEDNNRYPDRFNISEFVKSRSGQIIEKAIRSFGSMKTFENNKSYSIKMWNLLLTKYYSLSYFVLPAPHPEYLMNIALNLDAESEEAETVLDFLKLVQQYETVLFEQLNLKKNISIIDEKIQEKLLTLIECGEELYESERDSEYESKYNDWTSEFSNLSDIIEDFYYWSSLEKPVLKIQQLVKLDRDMPAPNDDDDDDEIQSNEEIDKEYWTISRMFEDL